MDNLEPYVESEYNTGPYNLLRGERGMIVKTLNQTDTIKRASNILSVSVKTMYRKIVRHQILSEVNRRGYLKYYIETKDA